MSFNGKAKRNAVACFFVYPVVTKSLSYDVLPTPGSPVTISTDNIFESNEFRDSVGAHWPFLSDAGRKVQQDLDIQEYTDPHHNPMIPHTLVLEPGLIVYKIYNGYWFWGRPSTAELWQDLREVSRKIRPDWDLSKPGLRENFEGDKTLHYPYKAAQ